MRTIAIIYESCSNFPAIDHNQRTLEKIFEGHVTIRNYYFDQLREGQTIEGDAFLLSNERLLSPLRPFISDFKKVIMMRRSIQKTGIPAIKDIPEGTDVLVVNDSSDSCVHTVYMLYELGISHLNLIPYDENRDADGIYLGLNYAVTPGEGWMVPPYIPHVIDFHYRVISFDTLCRISTLLNLDSDIIDRNLIKHRNMLAEFTDNRADKFMASHLKSQMINLIVRDFPSAIFAVDMEYHLIYSNEQADNLLHSTDFLPHVPGNRLEKEPLTMLKDIKSNTIIELNGERYMVEKAPLSLMDQLMGYCFTLQSESSLKQKEISLNHHLQQKGPAAKYHFQDIIYTSPVMEKTIIIAKQAAATDHTVLIRGESGTGKELLAQSIHNYSSRKNYPFVAINCNTLPESLLESQLFGYEGGSFTGARKEGKPGLFEQANQGTIFLDEIGDISPNLQSQLLRVLQERQIMRIGSDKVIDLDVRIIAATNQDLEKLVEEGRFRSDLLYRLNVIPLEVPPLRQRKEDILPLLSVFLKDLYEKISDEEKIDLCRYPWPGNIRQLESAAKYYETLHAFPGYLHTETPSLQDGAAAGDFTAADLASMASPPLRQASPAFQMAATLERTNQSHIPQENPNLSPAALERHILFLISLSTEPFHGIGRSGILTRLREQHIRMSDGKLREILARFEADGLITIAKGRGGCRITEKGADCLNNHVYT